MSLAIHPDRVTAVLLADGWHSVVAGSFEVDAYEIVDEGEPLTRSKDGFFFYEARRSDLFHGEPVTGTVDWVAGPFDAILALRGPQST